jgi:hypothetical protein
MGGGCVKNLLGDFWRGLRDVNNGDLRCHAFVLDVSCSSCGKVNMVMELWMKQT